MKLEANEEEILGSVERDDTSHVVAEKGAEDSTTVTERRERTYELVYIDGERYFRVTAMQGKPLSAEEVRKEREREASFRKRLAERPKDVHDEDDVEFNEELVNRYKFTAAGSEVLNGRPAHVLRFVPKSQSLPVRPRVRNTFDGFRNIA